MKGLKEHTQKQTLATFVGYVVGFFLVVSYAIFVFKDLSTFPCDAPCIGTNRRHAESKDTEVHSCWRMCVAHLLWKAKTVWHM